MQLIVSRINLLLHRKIGGLLNYFTKGEALLPTAKGVTNF